MNASEKYKYDQFLKQAENDEDRAWELYLKWKCLTDLYFLGTQVFKWGKNHKKRHNRIDPKFHRWLTNLIESPKDSMILVPRDHMKSSWLKLKIVQDVLINPNIRILLVSSTKRLVVQELTSIKRLFANPVLMRLFPDVIPNPGKDYGGWEKSTEQELTLRRDQSIFIPQGPQILAVGIGARIVGFHFDRAYLDDVVDDKSVTTLDQIQKAIDWWGYLQPMMEPKAVIKVVGTPWHYLDLYSDLERSGIFENCLYRRSCIENGKPIYSFFTLKDLERKRRMMRDEYKWNTQWMCNPVPTELKFFPPPQPTFRQLPPGKYKYYIAVDPAATVKAWSDHTGIVVGAVNELNHLFIVESLKVKFKANELADLIIKKQIQYQPIRIGIELGLQSALKYLIELKVSEWEKSNHKRMAMNIMEIPISRQKSKAQRIEASLGAFMREHKCLIQENCTELINEMGFYTGKDSDEDNLIDAASMLFSVVDTFAQHYWFEKQFRQPGIYLKDLFAPKAKGWEAQFVG